MYNKVKNAQNITRIGKKNIFIVEDLLTEWFEYYRSINYPINDQILIERAKIIYNILKNKGIDLPEKFEFSPGWFGKYKTRNNIEKKRLYGESGKINDDLEFFLKVERNKLSKLIKQF